MQDGAVVSHQWTTRRLGGLAAFVLGVMMLTMTGLTGHWRDSALMVLVTVAIIVEGINLAGVFWRDTFSHYLAAVAYGLTAVGAYAFARLMPTGHPEALLVVVMLIGWLAITTALLAYIGTRAEQRAGIT